MFYIQVKLCRVINLDTVYVLTFPGHYTINDKLVSDSPKIATAPFKSTTERKMMESPVQYPGPGSYKPFEKVDLERRSNKQAGFQ